MAGRSIVFATGQYYHIFNRGIARQPVFFSKRDYGRFILALSYYRFANPPLKLSRLLSLPPDTRFQLLKDIEKQPIMVEIIAYVCMPNHIHLLLKQTADRGITVYMSKLTNSYTRYVNTKQKRVGDLFQGVFKAVRVETDEQLIHLSRYIHLNPLVSFVVKDTELFSYPWSSLPNYMTGQSTFVTMEPIISQFKSIESYKKFLLDHIDYGRKLEEIKHLVLDH